MDNVLIEVKNLEKIFRAEKSFLAPKKEDNYVLKGVNLVINKGEIVSLAGESGCGKSTLANCILKLLKPDKGEILFEGKNILEFNKKETFNYRRNSYGAFNYS